MDERKWRFRSRDSGFERVTPLGSIARSMARSTTTPTTKRGPGKWLPSSLVSHANDDAGAGVLLAAMSHPTNGTASNFRVAKFRDSSGLVAP